MGLKAAVQALKKAEKLKEKVQNSKDILNDNEAWMCQQQLQRIYQQVLILDLEYALDKKVEQDLWNHGFKNYIGTLQSLAKDKKNPKRSESQAMLSWCLEAASGFYLTLLQEICSAFDLDLPFRRKGSVYGNGKISRAVEHLSQPHKSSCYYICQHCLVHLGDIARYRNQSRQAESFYRHAVQLAPSSGQPYNQLALLEASRGDRLSTVFHYVRSVAVRHFFPAAATNLSRTFNKGAEEQINVEGKTKISVSEYVSLFLKLHGLLHTASDLALAEKYVKVLTSTLTAHVATESFTSWKLVQMLTINLFALHHAGGALEDGICSDYQLSEEEKQVKHLVTDLMAGSLSAYLLPVYTLKEGEPLLEYFALPAIKLTLEWIRLEPTVLLDSAFTTRLQIWPSLCKLLNGLQISLTDFSSEKYCRVPLPEDRDLQGFLPLQKAISDLRFSPHDLKLDILDIQKIRAHRLVEFGRWLSEQELGGHRLVVIRSDGSGDRIAPSITSTVTGVTSSNNTNTNHASTMEVKEPEIVFEAVGQQVPPSDLIKELEELSLTKDSMPKLPSPVPSDTSWSTGKSTPEIEPRGPQSPKEVEQQEGDGKDRKPGILKPQGSLEKAREKEREWEVTTEKAPDMVWNQVAVTTKKGRQNVAMQAIMRKTQPICLNEEQNTPRILETKQVTFKTPSPSVSPNSSQGTDENSVLSSWQQQAKQQQQQQQQQQSYAYHQAQQHLQRQQTVYTNSIQPQATQQQQHHHQQQLPNMQRAPQQNDLRLSTSYPPVPNFPPLNPNSAPFQIPQANLPFMKQDMSLSTHHNSTPKQTFNTSEPRMNSMQVPNPGGSPQGNMTMQEQRNMTMNNFQSQYNMKAREMALNNMRQQTQSSVKMSPYGSVVNSLQASNQSHIWPSADGLNTSSHISLVDEGKLSGINVPPIPPASWWGENSNQNRRSRAPVRQGSGQDESQLMGGNMPYTMNYLQGSVMHGVQNQSNPTMSKNPTDMGTSSGSVGLDLYGGPQSHALGSPAGWVQPGQNLPSSHHVSNPANLNLAQLIGHLQGGPYSPSAVHRPMVQPSDLLSSSTNFQPSRVGPKMSMFNPESRGLMSESNDMNLKTENKREVRTTMGENNVLSSGGGSAFSVGMGSTYSLFSTPTWVTSTGHPKDDLGTSNSQNSGVMRNMTSTANNPLMVQAPLQSLWSGPGPSPLERLLEQQKQQREGPAPKGGT